MDEEEGSPSTLNLQEHPPIQVLVQYVLGQLDREAQRSIALHTMGCKECTDREGEIEREFFL